MGDGRSERVGVGGGRIRLDVGPGEGVRVAGAVDGGDVHALSLEGLGDAGGPGEEVERAAGAGDLADAGQDRDEAALRSDVLDHGRACPVGAVTQPTLRWVAMALGDRPDGGLGAGRLALGALARGLRGPRLAVVAPAAAGAGDGPGLSRPGAIERWRADPHREHVRRAGARRDRRGGDPSTAVRGFGPAGRARSGPGRLRPGAGCVLRCGRSGADRGGDASLSRCYEAQVPADLVLVCGVFGNISSEDISRTITALRGFCRRGSEVIWTRHRRPPDATPTIRADFAAAGFEEVDFEDPGGFVLSVGRQRFVGEPLAFDPATKLFDFVGDGFLPA